MPLRSRCPLPSQPLAALGVLVLDLIDVQSNGLWTSFRAGPVLLTQSGVSLFSMRLIHCLLYASKLSLTFDCSASLGFKQSF